MEPQTNNIKKGIGQMDRVVKEAINYDELKQDVEIDEEINRIDNLINPSIVLLPSNGKSFRRNPSMRIETMGKHVSFVLLAVSYINPILSLFVLPPYSASATYTGGIDACKGLYTYNIIAGGIVAFLFCAFGFFCFREMKSWWNWDIIQRLLLVELLFGFMKQALYLAAGNLSQCNDSYKFVNELQHTLGTAFSFNIGAYVYTLDVALLVIGIIRTVAFRFSPPEAPGLNTYFKAILLGIFILVSVLNDAQESLAFFLGVYFLWLIHTMYMAYFYLSKASYNLVKARQLLFYYLLGPFLFQIVLSTASGSGVSGTTFYSVYISLLVRSTVSFFLLLPVHKPKQWMEKYGVPVYKFEASMNQELDGSRASVQSKTSGDDEKEELPSNLDVESIEVDESNRRIYRTAAGFCLETTCWAFNGACLAYYDHSGVKTLGGYGLMDKEFMKTSRLQMEEFIYDPETDSVCSILSETNRLLVCFRGTSSKVNIGTDLEAWVVWAQLDGAPTEFRLHHGFWTAYSSVRERVSAKLISLLEESPRDVLICGHSLGGAMATLCAADSIQKLKKYNTTVSLYTFGSPRVGDDNFASYIEDNIQRNFRCIVEGDVVTGVPTRFLGTLLYSLKCMCFRCPRHEYPVPMFRHVGNSVVFDLKMRGDLMINPSFSETTFYIKSKRIASSHGMKMYYKCLLTTLQNFRADDEAKVGSYVSEQAEIFRKYWDSIKADERNSRLRKNADIAIQHFVAGMKDSLHTAKTSIVELAERFASPGETVDSQESTRLLHEAAERIPEEFEIPVPLQQIFPSLAPAQPEDATSDDGAATGKFGVGSSLENTTTNPEGLVAPEIKVDGETTGSVEGTETPVVGAETLVDADSVGVVTAPVAAAPADGSMIDIPASVDAPNGVKVEPGSTGDESGEHGDSASEEKP